MSENSSGTAGSTQNLTEESRGRGPGRCCAGSAILFVIFAGARRFTRSRSAAEHKVLAQQTEQMAVPYVSVIHADGDRTRIPKWFCPER